MKQLTALFLVFASLTSYAGTNFVSCSRVYGDYTFSIQKNTATNSLVTFELKKYNRNGAKAIQIGSDNVLITKATVATAQIIRPKIRIEKLLEDTEGMIALIQGLDSKAEYFTEEKVQELLIGLQCF